MSHLDTDTEIGKPRLNLLVVDVDTAVREVCRDVAAGLGLATRLVDTAEAARHAVSTAPVHLVLMDLRLPGGGIDLLRQMRELRPDIAIIIASMSTSIPFAVETMRCGAYDFVPKPFHLAELRVALTRATEQWLRARQTQSVRERMQLARSGLDVNQRMTIIGDSPDMEKLYRTIDTAAASASSVLILGEIGTGKELAARAIHALSPQAKMPFVIVDCRAIAPTRIEGEIFGRVANGNLQAGLLARAHGGTVFFDEIGELPFEAQGKLVRALQEKQVHPLDGIAAAAAEVRVLAATSRDLDYASQAGKFRRDLYFRLNVVKVNVPPLRQRKSDIPLLAAHFLARNSRPGDARMQLTDAVIETLMDYDWPGNVREFETCMQRASEMTPGDFISQFQMLTQVRTAREESLAASKNAQQESFGQENFGIVPLAVMEKQAILDALERLGGDRLEAAKHLQIGKTTLYRKLREYAV
ncbi:MAG: sigma-54 dependent transcriptional regulator [Acidobacteriaceae bacterium]